MVIPALVVLVLVLAVAAAVPERVPRAGRTSAARRLLDQRLTAGDITAEEHAQRAAVLSETRRASWRWSPVAVAVVGLGLILWGTAWRTGPGWGGANHVPAMDVHHRGSHMSVGAAEPPVAGAPEVTVTVMDLRFEPAVIEVPGGQTVNITLVNDGQVFHDLFVPTLGFMLDAEAGKRAVGSLTVGDAGRHEFICSVPGHAEAGMRGVIEVRQAEAP